VVVGRRGGGERERLLRKVRDLMEKMAKGELTRAEAASALAELEAMARRVERVSEIARDRAPVELSPYMRSLLKMAREPEVPASAGTRAAVNF
jgi:hypothetical protein